VVNNKKRVLQLDRGRYSGAPGSYLGRGTLRELTPLLQRLCNLIPKLLNGKTGEKSRNTIEPFKILIRVSPKLPDVVHGSRLVSERISASSLGS